MSGLPAHDDLHQMIAAAAEDADFFFAPSPATNIDLSNAPRLAAAAIVPTDNGTVLRIAGGDRDAPSGGRTGGYSIRVPDEVELAASGRRIRITAIARAEAPGIAARLALAYSTNDVGNSGWRWFSVGPQWSVLETDYDVPTMKDGHGDFIGLLPDEPGLPTVEISAVAIQVDYTGRWANLWEAILKLRVPGFSFSSPDASGLAAHLNRAFLQYDDKALSIRSFVRWVRKRRSASPFDLAGVSAFCLDNGLFEDANSLANRAFADHPSDMEIALLLSECRAARMRGNFAPKKNDVFCQRPFEHFEVGTKGDVFLCCAAWVPRPIGNLNRQSWGDIWNSDAAREIRSSIHDGSYRYCSPVLCPLIVEGTLPRTSDMARQSKYKKTIEQKEVRLPTPPEFVNLSNDLTCNLACPSCRTKKIIAKDGQKKALEAQAEGGILSLLKNTRVVNMTGSGDPFASHYFRSLLKNTRSEEYRHLKISLQTNGLLFDEKAWTDLHLEGRINRVLVSVDASSETTYSVVRKGGQFHRLLANLRLIARLRAEDKIPFFRLDFVVQWRNFRDMPGFVALARALNADAALFQGLYNWGTFSADQFLQESITHADHPDHEKFLEVLRSPTLDWDRIVWGNIGQFRKFALQSGSDARQ